MTTAPVPRPSRLHERGNREVLDAALTLCTSLDSEWRSLGARLLGELGLAGTDISRRSAATNSSRLFAAIPPRRW